MRRLVQIAMHPQTTTRLCHSSEESPVKTPGCSENSLLDFQFPFKNMGWNGTTLKIYLNRSLLQWYKGSSNVGAHHNRRTTHTCINIFWFTSHTTCISRFPSSRCLYSCWNRRPSHPKVWAMIGSTTDISICWLNQSAIMEARDEGSLMEHSDLDELLSMPVYPPDYKSWIRSVNLHMQYGSILTQLLPFAILICLIHVPTGIVKMPLPNIYSMAPFTPLFQYLILFLDLA
jgi:hypothetical protein